MSGSNGNDWNKYLNGTDSYNFSYSKNEHTPHPMSSTPLQPQSSSAVINTNKSINPQILVNPKKYGGKRKSRRHTKKLRRTRPK